MARKKFYVSILMLMASLSSCAYFMKHEERRVENVAETALPQCYWMENVTGKYEWVATAVVLGEGYDYQQCYAADSCNGGLGESGGGCYKWADSAQSQAHPWKSNQ